MEKQLLVLLLEDNANDVELLRLTLESAGLQVVFEHVSSGLILNRRSEPANRT